MERYSNSTREVAQDGRRGALMLSVSINHPDAEDFIDAKMEQGKVTGANVSVRIDDEFMNAVKSDAEYVQKYPILVQILNIRKLFKPRKFGTKLFIMLGSLPNLVFFWDTIQRSPFQIVMLI